MIPPKPAARAERVSLWRYLRLFRQDILSAQPERLYRAWMAEFRTPFFRSYLVNQPSLVKTVLQERPMEFPKSDRVGEGLRPLLGQSVFLTNGAVWERQRRIIDPAFEGGRLRETFPAMRDAGAAAVARLAALAGPTPVEIEAVTSHAAADVIFRTLFSIPIEHRIAAEVFEAFRAYQRTQPILNLAAFLPLPRWMPRFHRRRTRATAREIRALISRLTDQLGWPMLDTLDAVGAFTACPGAHALFIPGDARRNLETADVAVILPELQMAFQGKFDCAVVADAIEAPLRESTGVLKTPSLLFYRDGTFLGGIPKVRDWDDYMARIAHLLALTPQAAE